MKEIKKAPILYSSQYDPLTGQTSNTQITNPLYSPTSYLSSANAENKIAENNIKYPQTNPAIPLPTATKSYSTGDTSPEAITWREEQSKLYGGTTKTAKFVNDNGQTITFTAEDLTNTNNIQKLKDNGYVFSEGDFVPNLELTPAKQTAYDTASSALESTKQQFISYNIDQDPEFQAKVNSIKQQYDILQSQMEKTNLSREKVLKTIGLRGGTAEFAGGIQMGLEGEELNQANTRIAELNRQEAEVISAARTAYQNGKWTEYANKIALLKDTRDETAKVLDKYNTKLAEATKLQRETERTYKIDSTISDFVTNGITDQNEIMKAFEKAGMGVTAKEVDATLKLISPNRNIDEHLKLISSISAILNKNLTDDEGYNQQLIGAFAAQYDLDPIQLESGLLDYQNTAQKYGGGDIGLYQMYSEQEKASGGTPVSLLDFLKAKKEYTTIPSEAGGGLDWKTTNYINQQNKNFESSPIVKQFNEVQNKYLSVAKIIDLGVGGPGDLALVFDFMKALDPTSVVRESEYKSAASSGNIFKGWAARFNGYMKAEGGFLPDNVKNAFEEIIGVKYGSIKSQYNNLRSEKSRIITKNTGIKNPEEYLTDYDYDLMDEKEPQPTTIKITRNGVAGRIPENEFDPKTDVKI